MGDGTNPQPEPTLIACEGGGCPVNYIGSGIASGICTMCGAEVELAPGFVAMAHQRMDILAMLDRGDYG
jgi:hypothetical protein